ncbi:MAG: hypothetical protein KKE91_02170, partial [Candidatus Omnitrophica bacterium]|nr:hypothetical protein [Candidatus Omnitrophota bacterium]
MTWFDFEQHVEDASGQGPLHHMVQGSEQIHQVRFSSVGKTPACRRQGTVLREINQGRTRYMPMNFTNLLLFYLDN